MSNVWSLPAVRKRHLGTILFLQNIHSLPIKIKITTTSPMVFFFFKFCNWLANTIYTKIQPWYEHNQKWTHHSSFENPANLVKAQLLLLKGYRSQQTASHWSWEGLINPFFLDCHHLHHLHFTSLLINDLIILGILICPLYFECQYSCIFCRWHNRLIKV